MSKFYYNKIILYLFLLICFSVLIYAQGLTHITNWNTLFGGNVTGEGFYEYDGTYVIPIFKVNWSQGIGDLEGYGINATIKVSNLNYAINLFWQNISNFPRDISFFDNDVGYITYYNLTIYENLSQFINDVGYILLSDLTWENISNKPTLISYWINDVGYITMLNLTELKEQIYQLNISLNEEKLIRNQTDELLFFLTNSIYNDLQNEIIARESGDYNNSLRLQNLNITLSQEINTIYNRLFILNTTKSGVGVCPEGYAVQNLTIGQPECVSIVNFETDPIFISNNNTIWNSIWDRLLITDQRYNDTALIYQIAGNLYTNIDYINISIQEINQTINNNINQLFYVITIVNETIQQEIIDRKDDTYILNTTKSGVGVCPEGYAVQNLTIGQPECVSIVNFETDPIFISNNNTIWNAILDRLLITDQRYNDTALIYLLNDTLIFEIDNLYLEIQNINLSLQNEIINRINLENYINLTIINISDEIMLERYARIQNDTYILSRIPSIFGDNIYINVDTDGQNYTIFFNETKLNETIEMQTGIFEENVTIIVSGGYGYGQTNQCCSGSVQILEVAVFPSLNNTNYKFYSNTSITGEIIDQNRKTHTGRWIVSHSGLIVFDEKINFYILNSNNDDIFRVRLRWRN